MPTYVTPPGGAPRNQTLTPSLCQELDQDDTCVSLEIPPNKHFEFDCYYHLVLPGSKAHSNAAHLDVATRRHSSLAVPLAHFICIKSRACVKEAYPK